MHLPMSSPPPSSSFLFLAFCYKTESNSLPPLHHCINVLRLNSAFCLTVSSPSCRCGTRIGSGTVRLISEWMSFSSVMLMAGSWKGKNTEHCAQSPNYPGTNQTSTLNVVTTLSKHDMYIFKLIPSSLGDQTLSLTLRKASSSSNFFGKKFATRSSAWKENRLYFSKRTPQLRQEPV